MAAAVKPMRGKRGYMSRYSNRQRVAKLHERLEIEKDPRVRDSIAAQLPALDRTFRPPEP